MDFLVVGLLVLFLAVMLISRYLLGRDIRRQFAALQGKIEKTNDALSINNNNIFQEWNHLIAETEARSKADAESMERTLLDLAHGVELLSSLMKALQKNSAQTFERLEAMLENAPDAFDREYEAKHGQSIEVGFANLLQYQVGKGKET